MYQRVCGCVCNFLGRWYIYIYIYIYILIKKCISCPTLHYLMPTEGRWYIYIYIYISCELWEVKILYRESSSFSGGNTLTFFKALNSNILCSFNSTLENNRSLHYNQRKFKFTFLFVHFKEFYLRFWFRMIILRGWAILYFAPEMGFGRWGYD